MKYIVKITFINQRTIAMEVNADSREDAMDIAEDSYNSLPILEDYGEYEDIILEIEEEYFE